MVKYSKINEFDSNNGWTTLKENWLTVKWVSTVKQTELTVIIIKYSKIKWFDSNIG